MSDDEDEDTKQSAAETLPKTQQTTCLRMEEILNVFWLFFLLHFRSSHHQSTKGKMLCCEYIKIYEHILVYIIKRTCAIEKCK